MLKAIVDCPGKTAPPKESDKAVCQGIWLPKLIEFAYIGLHWVNLSISQRIVERDGEKRF